MTTLEDSYLTAKQVRRLISGGDQNGMLGARTLDRMVRKGIIPPPVKFGAHRRWRKSRLLAALAKLEKQQA